MTITSTARDFGHLSAPDGPALTSDDESRGKFADEPQLSANLPEMDDEAEIQRLARYERIKREVRRRVDAEERGAQFDATPPASVRLSDLLVEPDSDIPDRISKVWPAGGRIMFTAPYKGGKTILRDNVVRSLVDGDPFLDTYNVTAIPAGRTVVILDTEMTREMLKKWLRDQNIRASHRVVLWSLRGRVASFDILDRACRARWASDLRAARAGVLILDCQRPALDALGLDEHRDGGRFLTAFDALLAEADVDEAIVIHHQGHQGERARGDSRFRDWPDAEWRLIREAPKDGTEPAADAPRYFAALGRDVDVPETRLEYDKVTRRLRLAGGNRHDAAAARILPDLHAFLTAQPGASTRDVQALTEHGHGRDDIRRALALGIRKGCIDRTERPGRGGGFAHTLKCANRAEPCEHSCGSARRPIGARTSTVSQAPPKCAGAERSDDAFVL